MLGDCRLRERQFVDDLTAHTSLFPREHAKNANASWMADCLRQLCQFIIGVRTLKTLKVCLRRRFGRRAADGIWLCSFIYSHSTINDTTAPDCRQALFTHWSSKSGIGIACSEREDGHSEVGSNGVSECVHAVGVYFIVRDRRCFNAYSQVCAGPPGLAVRPANQVLATREKPAGGPAADKGVRPTGPRQP
ncbi:MAG: hypothetical protein ABSB88_11600 [Bryobacteraceae bacterium]